MKIIATYVIAIGVIAGLGYFLFQKSQVNPADLPGQAYEIQGAEHIAQGLTEHPPYNSNPPTSGWHWPQPAAWGTYDQPQPDEQLIHNMEHGGVWIAYKPDLDSAQVEQLNDFAQRFKKVVVAPRPANDASIVFAAWGRLQKFDSYHEGEMLKFIRAYYDKGPEKVD